MDLGPNEDPGGSFKPRWALRIVHLQRQSRAVKTEGRTALEFPAASPAIPPAM